jgi:hypothetical protein
MKAIVNYLKYPSTWQGLLAIAAAVGINLAPEMQNAILTIGLAVGGLIAAKFSDSDVEK